MAGCPTFTRSPRPSLPRGRRPRPAASPWDPESEADVATWLRGLSDPEFQRWNTPVKIVRDLDSARDSLRSRAEAVADGTAVAFCVTDAATGTTLGHIGVNDINHVIRVGIVGYWVLPEARGHQVATRALALAARYAFGAVRLHRVELGHALGHDASCRIAERCGFPYEDAAGGDVRVGAARRVPGRTPARTDRDGPGADAAADGLRAPVEPGPARCAGPGKPEAPGMPCAGSCRV